MCWSAFPFEHNCFYLRHQVLMMCECNSSLYSSSSSGAKVTVGQTNTLIRGKPKVPIKTKKGATAEINKCRAWKTCFFFNHMGLDQITRSSTVAWWQQSVAEQIQDLDVQLGRDSFSHCSGCCWFTSNMTDWWKYHRGREKWKAWSEFLSHLGTLQNYFQPFKCFNRLSAELCLIFMG